MSGIRRREFVILLGGSAAAAWPVAARAQHDRQRLVGVVAGYSEAEMRAPLTAFRSKLNQLGWTEGRNLAIDARLGAGDYRRMTAEAGTLVSRNPDDARGHPGLTAVRQHTTSVPVVFTLVADPARAGLIESLARPGGHATGFTNFEFSIGGKWLELLRAISPHLTRVTVIANPANATANPLAGIIKDGGRLVSIEVTTASVYSASDIEAAISSPLNNPAVG